MPKANVLVTGVAGFIGSKVAAELANRDYNVFGIDDLSSGFLENIPKSIEFIEGDVCDIEKLLSVRIGFDSVLHLAGQSSGERSFSYPIEDVHKNYLSTLKLIEYSENREVAKLIHASSMSVYGDQNLVKPDRLHEGMAPNPTSIYGISKMSSEFALSRRANFPTLSFRMFNVYGPGQDLGRRDQGMVSIFLAQYLESKKFHVKGQLERCRDFVYIDDVVEYWCRAVDYEFTGHKAVNLCSGVCTSVEELLSIISRNSLEINIEVTKGTPGDQFSACGDNGILQNLLGNYEWTSLSKGVELFRNWAISDDSRGPSEG